MSSLIRRITFTPAYDYRARDQDQHGLVINFWVRGPEGAIVWSYHTGVYLKHSRTSPSSPYGDEICAHSSKPFPDSEGINLGCGWLDGIACHSAELTGSLFGRELGEQFLAEGEDVVWKVLETRYLALWPQLELDGL